MAQKTLTKKDIKDVLTPFTKAIQKDIGAISKRLDTVDAHIASVQYESQEGKKRLIRIEEQLEALFSKMDRIFTLFEKQQQEISFLSAEIKRLEERIAQLERK